MKILLSQLILSLILISHSSLNGQERYIKNSLLCSDIIEGFIDFYQNDDRENALYEFKFDETNYIACGYIISVAFKPETQTFYNLKIEWYNPENKIIKSDQFSISNYELYYCYEYELCELGYLDVNTNLIPGRYIVKFYKLGKDTVQFAQAEFKLLN